MMVAVAFAVLSASSALHASEQEAIAVFTHARDRLLADTARLPRYTCVQTITRTYFQAEADRLALHGCDAVLGARRKRQHDLVAALQDRLRLDVAAASSREIHSWAGASRFEDKELIDIIGWGPAGTGDFRGFVQSVFGERASITFEGERNEAGKRLFEYTFAVTREDSGYTVQNVGARVITAYDGSFVLDPENSDLVRMTTTTAELPEETELCQAENIIDYHRVSIGAAEILIPLKTRLRMVARDGVETENITSYAGCREYTSKSVVHFEGEEVPVPDGPPRRSTLPPPPLPAGLEFECRVNTPIDENSAAGDAVEAVLTAPIQDRYGVVLATRGSVIRGRIMRLAHHFGSQERFELGIRFESILLDGRELPFAATTAQVVGGGIVGRLRSRARLSFPSSVQPRVGTFVFPVKRLKLPHLDGKWVTVEPAADTADRSTIESR